VEVLATAGTEVISAGEWVEWAVMVCLGLVAMVMVGVGRVNLEVWEYLDAVHIATIRVAWVDGRYGLS